MTNTAEFWYKHDITAQSIRDAIECCTPHIDKITLHYPGVTLRLRNKRSNT